MIITIPARASSYTDFRSCDFSSDDDSYEGTTCTEMSDVSSWQLSWSSIDTPSTEKEDQACGQPTQVPAPGHRNTKQDTEAWCHCILFHDSRILTFAGAPDLNFPLTRGLVDNMVGDVYSTEVTDVLQSRFHVALKHAPIRAATYLFTHPQKTDLITHVYFGVVSHLTARNTDPESQPCYQRIQEALHYARFGSGARKVACYTSTKVALLRSLHAYSALVAEAARVPYSFDPFSCIDDHKTSTNDTT